MGKNAYTKCIELMKEIRKIGFENEVPLRELIKFIKIMVGSDTRTISKCLDNLIEFKFIKSNGNNIFQILDITEKLY